MTKPTRQAGACLAATRKGATVPQYRFTFNDMNHRLLP